MAISVRAYIALLVIVGALRLLELRVSRRNQRSMAARGVAKVPEPHFPWMVLLHIAILVGAALEVLLLRRPFIPLLAATMTVLVCCSFALRWWVIRVLAEHWNVQVMNSGRLGVVEDGPYRWVRHPNYVAVFVEMIALPMIHTAWITALAGTLAHTVLLRRRVQVEDSMLLANPEYERRMGYKPRFVPLWWPSSASRSSQRGNPVRRA